MEVHFNQPLSVETFSGQTKVSKENLTQILPDTEQQKAMMAWAKSHPEIIAKSQYLKSLCEVVCTKLGGNNRELQEIISSWQGLSGLSSHEKLDNWLGEFVGKISSGAKVEGQDRTYLMELNRNLCDCADIGIFDKATINTIVDKYKESLLCKPDLDRLLKLKNDGLITGEKFKEVVSSKNIEYFSRVKILEAVENEPKDIRKHVIESVLVAGPIVGLTEKAVQMLKSKDFSDQERTTILSKGVTPLCLNEEDLPLLKDAMPDLLDRLDRLDSRAQDYNAWIYFLNGVKQSNVFGEDVNKLIDQLFIKIEYNRPITYS